MKMDSFATAAKGLIENDKKNGADIADHAKTLAEQAATINAQTELIEDLESIVRD